MTRTMPCLPAVVLVVFTASAQAQEPPAQPPPAGVQRPLATLGDEMTPAEIQRLFDAYLLMEAQQALTLTDQQYPQFLTRLKGLQETRRRNQQQRNQLMNELQRLTSPRAQVKAEEALLKERLNTLQELDSRSAAELRKAYAALDEVLDVRQQARFRVFEEQIERRKLELLLRARQNRAIQKRNQQ